MDDTDVEGRQASCLPDDLLMADCANCGRWLISPREYWRVQAMPKGDRIHSFKFVEEWIDDAKLAGHKRPLCFDCSGALHQKLQADLEAKRQREAVA